MHKNERTMAILFKLRSSDSCAVQWIFHKPVKVFTRPPPPPPPPPSSSLLEMKSIHNIWIVLLLSLDTLIVFWFFFRLLSALIHNRSGGACCLRAFSSDDGGPWAWASFLVGNWRGLTPSKASITIRRVMALARVVWKRADLQKVMRRWDGGGRRMFGVKTYFMRVRLDILHMCVKLNLGCLYRWETQRRPGQQWIGNAGACAHIVLTALNVLQPNKHFITATNSSGAALLHQGKMFGS